jgi:hypothetical protein
VSFGGPMSLECIPGRVLLLQASTIHALDILQLEEKAGSLLVSKLRIDFEFKQLYKF